MNMAFALSALGLLATSLWMAFADYAQPWKRIQSEFRSLERQELMLEAQDESAKLDQNALTQLKQEAAAAQADLDRHRQEIETIADEVKDWDTKRYTADADWKGAKAVVDARKFEYDIALQEHGEEAARDERGDYEKAKQELAAAKAELETMEVGLAAAQGRLAERRAALTAAEKKLEDLQSGVANLGTRIANLKKDFD
jgi:chromosome segregation ATPase